MTSKYNGDINLACTRDFLEHISRFWLFYFRFIGRFNQLIYHPHTQWFPEVKHVKKMTTVSVLGLSILAIGLLCASAFAYNLGQQPNQQYGQYSSTSLPRLGRGMMGGGYMGGLMGNGFSPYSGYSASNGYSQQYAYGVNGYGRCMGSWGWPQTHDIILWQ